jgi:cytosine/adenosine deaminase-related metal-dependent hydrolase
MDRRWRLAGRHPVEDGAIAAIGRSLRRPTPRHRRAGMIALPGIIDAHTCLWQTVLRGYVPRSLAGTVLPLACCSLRRHFTPEDNFNRRVCRRLRDAVLRHHHCGRTTATTSPAPTTRPRSIAALGETGIATGSSPTRSWAAEPERFAADGTASDDARRGPCRVHDPGGLT